MKSAANNRLIESRFRPFWAEEAGLDRCFFYRGDSMAPTFRPGQLLWLDTGAAIRPGDVVVFPGPSDGCVLAHRVVANSERGWITRGDNNSRPDGSQVPSSRIIGRVEIVEEGGRLSRVRGGRIELAKARFRWGAKKIRRYLGRCFGHPYRALRRSGIVSRLFHRFLKKHLLTVRLNTAQGPVYKTTFRGRVIARWWPGLDVYYCRKPFDLLLGEPHPNVRSEGDPV